MDIYTLGIIVSILIYVVVGNYAGRKVKGLEDYFVAGRAAPTVLIVGTLVASLMSTNTFLGDAAMSYEGYAGMWILAPATHAVGVAIGAMWFGRYLRRSECLTVAEFLRRCYDSPRIQTLAGLTVIFGIGGYLLAVTQGAALILEETSGLSYSASLIIAWLGYTLFTFYAGSRGVVLTDTIMFVLFVVFAVLGLGYIVNGVGGIQTAIIEVAQIETKRDMLSIQGMTGPGANWATPVESLIWIHTINLAWGFVYIISPHQAGRHLMAKSEHVVIRAGVVATIFITIIQLAIWTAAAVINVYDADISPSSDSILWAAKNAMPPVVGSIMLAGLMAAALSSASTFLSLTGFSVSYDIVPERNSAKEGMLRRSRITMMILGVVVLLIALFIKPNIFQITYFVGTLFASAWAAAALMGIYSRKITEDAAFWSIVAGFGLNVGLRALTEIGWLLLPVWASPLILGAVGSLVIAWTLSRFGSPTQAALDFRQSLREVPEIECDKSEVKKTLRACKVFAIYGVLIGMALLWFYVRPLQLATGEVIGNGLTLIGAESLSAIAYGALLVITALFIYRKTRATYGNNL